jgi:hypothetical protein
MFCMQTDNALKSIPDASLLASPIVSVGNLLYMTFVSACKTASRCTSNLTLLNYLPHSPFYFEVQAFRSNGKTALQLID